MWSVALLAAVTWAAAGATMVRSSLARPPFLHNFDDYDIGGACDPQSPTKAYNQGMKRYRDLCNLTTARLTPADSFSRSLKCWLHRGQGNGLLMIQPLHAERVTFVPNMVFFHNIITDNVINYFKTQTKDKLFASKVSDTIDGNPGGHREQSRISQQVWLHTAGRPLVEWLQHIVTDATGISYETFESMQVVWYPVGGYYDPHYDFFTVPNIDPVAYGVDRQGDRLATFLFYLNEPVRGGGTAFPCAGVAVTPEKGGGIFWYNLDDSGRPMTSSLHGACDLLEGEKWIANWWIRERGPTGFSRQCPTQPHFLTQSQFPY